MLLFEFHFEFVAGDARFDLRGFLPHEEFVFEVVDFGEGSFELFSFIFFVDEGGELFFLCLDDIF